LLAPLPVPLAAAGLVERVTFHDAETGFCVLCVEACGREDLVTVVGHAATIGAGEFVSASGAWVRWCVRRTPPCQAGGRAGQAVGRVGTQALHERLLGLLQSGPRRGEQRRAPAPGEHDEGDGGGQQQREPAAVEQLDEVRAEEHRSTRKKAPFTASTSSGW
jgi:hypothetical protein